jgi:hypothetical protein
MPPIMRFSHHSFTNSPKKLILIGFSATFWVVFSLFNLEAVCADKVSRKNRKGKRISVTFQRLGALPMFRRSDLSVI